ncbi:Uncharacterised protein [Helicobacter cinaedi]|uniref:Uncharacterized protein n=1 Tax=Helicobacter cinaedi TaxID=213 RepID=A0A377JWV2_9HELI|nr:Uncharacterised protein [Helicobacter cinaedi]
MASVAFASKSYVNRIKTNLCYNPAFLYAILGEK